MLLKKREKDKERQMQTPLVRSLLQCGLFLVMLQLCIQDARGERGVNAFFEESVGGLEQYSQDDAGLLVLALNPAWRHKQVSMQSHDYDDDDGITKPLQKAEIDDAHTEAGDAQGRHRDLYGRRTSVLFWLYAGMHAFSPRIVTIQCYDQGGEAGKTYLQPNIYLGRTISEVQNKSLNGKREWCGWQNMICRLQSEKAKGDENIGGHCDAMGCSLVLSGDFMFENCVVGIEISKSTQRERSLLGFRGSGGEHGEFGSWRVLYRPSKKSLGSENELDVIQQEMLPHNRLCLVDESNAFSVVRAFVWIVGVLMVLYAGRLSESTSFRLAGGSFTFVILSGILLLYIVWRHIPHKKSLFVSVMLFGGALAGFLRMVFIGPMEILQSMINSPILYVYMTGSALVGLAVTYYFNDETNVKLNTILRVGIRMLGGLIMFLAPVSWEGALVVGGSVIMFSQAKTVSNFASQIQGQRKGKVQGSRDGGEDEGDQGIQTDGAVMQPDSPLSPSGIQTLPQRYDSQTPVKIGSNIDRDQREHRSTTVGTPLVFKLSTIGMPPSPDDYDDKSKLSPLVQRGKILNVETDRTIMIGKGTYNKLLMDGYEVDFEKGIITPPEGKKSR